NGTGGDDFIRNFTITAPIPLADLALTKVASHDTIALGSGNVTYTLTITNTGPNTASSVTLTDTLPVNTAGVSVDAGSGATCTQPSGLVVCNVGDLANAATKTVTVTVTPTSAGQLVNSATVGSATVDPNNANDADSATTTVTAPVGSADVSVTAGAASSMRLDTIQTYTFTVQNLGPDAAASVQFDSTVPTGLELVSANSTLGSCTTNAGTGLVSCALGNMNSGASANVTITVRATSVGNKGLSATVSTATADPTPINNSATQSITVTQIKLFLPIIIRPAA
ncbi:MAG TPA: DUF11 domain-containing protein, partial [Roseiflexaceae bacterium]|nr:DUF11 domain-containing protein [Roseiflexaceae bacterium]